MVLALIGESCMGKSSIAGALKKAFPNTVVYTGKDYQRLGKDENQAKVIFTEMLEENAQTDSLFIYVITEKEHLDFLNDKCIKVVFTADIETIEERFKKRMRGNLPVPVSVMLRKKHGVFDKEKCNPAVNTTIEDQDSVLKKVREFILI